MLHFMKGYFYILTNRNNSVIYAGVTSDLKGRILAMTIDGQGNCEARSAEAIINEVQLPK